MAVHTEAARGSPGELRGVAADTFYLLLFDQQVNRKALVLTARKVGLLDDPAIAVCRNQFSG